jgi:hypothetical protein
MPELRTRSAGARVTKKEYAEIERLADGQDKNHCRKADQKEATTFAQESMQLFTDRYIGGADPYLQVLTAQTIALQMERNDVDILRRRMDASVLLIKAPRGEDGLYPNCRKVRNGVDHRLQSSGLGEKNGLDKTKSLESPHICRLETYEYQPNESVAVF